MIAQIVASNLVWLRKERGVSLSELSRRSGVAKATLSSLEAGAANPRLETLWAIVSALEISMGDLLDQNDPKRRVVRASDTEWVHGPILSGRFVDRLSGRSVLEIYEIRLLPGERYRKEGKAPGEIDQVFVLSGRLLAGPEENPEVLSPGDFVRYVADRPYVFEALDGAEARALQLMTLVRPSANPASVESVRASLGADGSGGRAVSGARAARSSRSRAGAGRKRLSQKGKH